MGRWAGHDNNTYRWCPVSLVVPLPLRALNPAGVNLQVLEPLLPVSALVGAQVTDFTGVIRVEALHPSLSMVTSMRWKHIFRAGTALLNDGQLALLLFGDMQQPVLDVLALPVEDRQIDTLRDGCAFSALLGRMLARGAANGGLVITEGDLSWLHPRLDPFSPEYFKN